MQPIDRRAFLRALSSAAVTATFAKSIEKAVATPAHYRSGTIEDIEHVVFLMQENRAFDHYFGTMRGVRGYGDPRPAILPSGKPVWYQPDGSSYVLPFHPTIDNLGMAFLEDTPHGWSDTQAAWNGGQYDQWIPHKGRSTMAYLTRKDIPFHYALADAFTVCDAYHCSLLAPRTRIAITCGRAGSATTGRAVARSSATLKRATTGRRIPSVSSATAFHGRSIRTAASASTDPASGAGASLRRAPRDWARYV